MEIIKPHFNGNATLVLNTRHKGTIVICTRFHQRTRLVTSVGSTFSLVEKRKNTAITSTVYLGASYQE